MFDVRKKRIVVVGSFGYGISGLDGQTIKTQNVFRLIQERAPDTRLNKVDTLEIRHRFSKLITGIWNILSCSKMVMLPADNSLAVLFPMCYVLSFLFKFEIILICIGGWQPEFFVGGTRWRAHRMSMRMCRKIKMFMPEMSSVERTLREELGFSNTRVFPNFRFVTSRALSDFNNGAPLQCVFMARVNKMKGYIDLFSAFSMLRKIGCFARLSIFGSIANEDTNDFYKLLAQADNVHYGGEIEPSKVNEVLSRFDVLLLPTHYFTEGFPGSVLDAYYAGIPVIVSEWKYAHEFVEDGKTGLIYPFGDEGELLADSILKLDAQRDSLNQMKNNARNAIVDFSDETAWEAIKDIM